MKEIEEDAKKYCAAYIRGGVKEGRKQAIKIAKQAIDMFYNSYSPRRYHRVWNIETNSWRPVARYGVEEGEFGIELSSSGMHEYKNTDVSAATIFDWVINHGYHGSVAQTIEAPYDMMTRLMSEGAYEDAVQKAAEKAGSAASRFF